MTAIPPYVPPHLRGRVGDFGDEPNGDVSFTDTQAALGLGPDDSRKTISRAKFQQTFDRNTRLADLEGSLADQYGSPLKSYGDSGWAGDMRDRIAKSVRGGLHWGTTTPGKAIGTAALVSGLAGGVGGYMLSRDSDSPWRNGALAALLTGALGAGATALAQRQNNQRAAALSKTASTAESMIMHAISSDYGMSREDKITLMNLARDLRASDAAELSRVLRGATGAGVGMLVVKFLKLKGLLPMLVGGMLGAAIGGQQSPRRNALGQISL